MVNNFDSSTNMMTIPRSLLHWVYIIVPVLLGVMLVDMYFLEWKLSPYLSVNALFFPVFIFLFNFPHIIASFFSFFDREYIKHYRKHLFFYLPVLLLVLAAILYKNYLLGLTIFLVSDIWHGIKQKVGIALILGARPGWLYQSWTWVTFIASALAVVFMILGPNIFPSFLLPYLPRILTIGASLILVFMILMLWQSAPKVRLYIFLVSSLFLVSYFFIMNGYIFFSILAFRFVHDISAFAFYITHDQNRNKSEKKNWIYAFFAATPLPVIILTPVLALLFAYLIRTLTDGLAIGYSIVILISFIHYYLESVMWKRGSPHREWVRVS